MQPEVLLGVSDRKHKVLALGLTPGMPSVRLRVSAQGYAVHWSTALWRGGVGEPRPAELALDLTPQCPGPDPPHPALPPPHGSGPGRIEIAKASGLELRRSGAEAVAGGGPRSFLGLCGMGQGDSPCHWDQEWVPGHAVRMVSEHGEGARQGCSPQLQAARGQPPAPWGTL